MLAHGSETTNRFSIKSGSAADLAGLKVGSYWPGNADAGLPRHHSAILLLDQSVGRVEWVIEAGKVNAYRTAAADAVAADTLARADASVLAFFGAGHQALYEVRALARVRPLRTALVVTRDRAKGEAFAATLVAEGMDARTADARTACELADIIGIATPARAALFEAEWIRPGTHVASMGSDAAGKQELPPALFDHAGLLCALPRSPSSSSATSSIIGAVTITSSPSATCWPGGIRGGGARRRSPFSTARASPYRTSTSPATLPLPCTAKPKDRP